MTNRPEAAHQMPFNLILRSLPSFNLPVTEGREFRTLQIHVGTIDTLTVHRLEHSRSCLVQVASPFSIFILHPIWPRGHRHCRRMAGLALISVRSIADIVAYDVKAKFCECFGELHLLIWLSSCYLACVSRRARGSTPTPPEHPRSQISPRLDDLYLDVLFPYDDPQSLCAVFMTASIHFC